LRCCSCVFFWNSGALDRRETRWFAPSSLSSSFSCFLLRHEKKFPTSRSRYFLSLPPVGPPFDLTPASVIGSGPFATFVLPPTCFVMCGRRRPPESATRFLLFSNKTGPAFLPPHVFFVLVRRLVYHGALLRREYSLPDFPFFFGRTPVVLFPWERLSRLNTFPFYHFVFRCWVYPRGHLL